MEKINIFQKYTSLTNHYMKEIIDNVFLYNPRFKKDKYVCYEKLDGSNVSIAITKDSVNYCSRTTTLGNDHTKVGFSGLGAVLEDYQALIKDVQALLQKENSDSLVTLYGEFFGKGIQKRIDYGDSKKVLFFDFSLDGVLQPQVEFIESFKHMGYEHLICPIEGIYDTFEEAMAVPNDSPSNLSPSKGMREGNVIKPYAQLPTMDSQRVFMVKHKNDKFTEVKAPSVPLTEEEIALLKQSELIKTRFMEYVNDNRLDSVLSKEEIEVSKKTMGKLITKLLLDAKEDFLLENEEYAKLPNIDKMIGKFGGKECARVILQRIG